MKLRWVLALLLVLNLSYLGWGLYRAQLPDGGRETEPLQRPPGVSEIRLLDSLVDSPPEWGANGPEAGWSPNTGDLP